MATSSKARRASNDNFVDNLKKTKEALDKRIANLRGRYNDSGTSGRDQLFKELKNLELERDALREKRLEKHREDTGNVDRYGKDAPRGRSFAKYNKGGMVQKANCGASMKPTQGKKS